MLVTDGTNYKGGMGPTFKLTKLDFSNFLFFWAEWITVAGLGSGGVLPANSGANYHLGAYAAANGVFLNPASVVTDSGNIWSQSAIVFAISETDPS